MKVFKEDSSKPLEVLLTDEMKRKFHNSISEVWDDSGLLYDTILLWKSGKFEMLSLYENGPHSCGKGGKINMPKELAELFQGKDKYHVKGFVSLETDIINP